MNGYTLITTPTNARGTYGLSNADVNYYYAVNYTIVPVTSNGTPIPSAPTKQSHGKPGEPVSASELPQVPGYTPVVTMVKVPGEPGKITVVYVPNVTTVLVEYVDQNGKQLRQPIRLQGQPGSRYQTDQLAFNGYQLIKVTGQPSGQYGQGETVVVYQYGSAGRTSQPANLPSTGSQAPSVTPSAGSQSPSAMPSMGSQVPSVAPSQGSTPPSKAGQPKGSAAPKTQSMTPKSAGPKGFGPVGKRSQPGSLRSAAKSVVPSQAESIAGVTGEKFSASKLATSAQPSVAKRSLPSHARLPQTGETQSNIWAIAGLSLLASGLIFASVRKYRRRTELAGREDEISRKL